MGQTEMCVCVEERGKIFALSMIEAVIYQFILIFLLTKDHKAVCNCMLSTTQYILFGLLGSEAIQVILTWHVHFISYQSSFVRPTYHSNVT